MEVLIAALIVGAAAALIVKIGRHVKAPANYPDTEENARKFTRLYPSKLLGTHELFQIADALCPEVTRRIKSNDWLQLYSELIWHMCANKIDRIDTTDKLWDIIIENKEQVQKEDAFRSEPYGATNFIRRCVFLHDQKINSRHADGTSFSTPLAPSAISWWDELATVFPVPLAPSSIKIVIEKFRRDVEGKELHLLPSQSERLELLRKALLKSHINTPGALHDMIVANYLDALKQDERMGGNWYDQISFAFMCLAYHNMKKEQLS